MNLGSSQSSHPQLTIGRPPRFAAIDIGTNSIRCIVAEVDPQQRFRILDDEKAMVRLGEGLNESGIISPAAIERAAEALLRMKQIMTGLGVEMIEAVATSAVRKAANGEEFIALMLERTGVSICIISGEEEARLAALSARHNFDMEGSRCTMADIGGGSVEIIEATGGHTETLLSLELGAVYLTERFIHSDPISEEEFEKLRKHIRKKLKRNAIGKGPPVSCLIGSGGTMTNIGGMVMAMRGEQYSSVHRYEVLRSEVVHLLAMLQRKNQKERRAIPGLNPQRADIILAGLALTEELMRRCRTNLLRINHKGIREGLILQGLQKNGLLPTTSMHRDWRSSVEELASTCHYDARHARQVGLMADVIFAAVADSSDLNARDGELLQAAALLHDIGYFISYDSHHKHSYHLIRHANLFGFSPRERELIANIARYHRKARPKLKHDNFAPLDEQNRQKVLQLGGILRLADGLDRRRDAKVREITTNLQNGRLQLTLGGEDDLRVEVYGGGAKADLFRQAFGLEVDLSQK